MLPREILNDVDLKNLHPLQKIVIDKLCTYISSLIKCNVTLNTSNLSELERLSGIDRSYFRHSKNGRAAEIIRTIIRNYGKWHDQKNTSITFGMPYKDDHNTHKNKFLAAHLSIENNPEESKRLHQLLYSALHKIGNLESQAHHKIIEIEELRNELQATNTTINNLKLQQEKDNQNNANLSNKITQLKNQISTHKITDLYCIESGRTILTL